MQELLNHTSERLVLYLNLNYEASDNKCFELYVKYGFDGTALVPYKQRWQNNASSDEHLLCTSLVPLQLRDVDTGEIVWKNPRPSSPKLCRPIKFEFVKETKAVIQKEEEYLNDQIDILHNISVHGCCIKFKLKLCLIDGKVSTEYCIKYCPNYIYYC